MRRSGPLTQQGSGRLWAASGTSGQKGSWVADKLGARITTTVTELSVVRWISNGRHLGVPYEKHSLCFVGASSQWCG